MQRASLAKYLKKGDYVVYESTVYPGCTEEDCVPILEELSGLKFKTDFKVRFSPERINPGDKEHTIIENLKVVAGCDEESLDNIAKIYGIIVQAGVHKASSLKLPKLLRLLKTRSVM